jgi:hypothetical protein
MLSLRNSDIYLQPHGFWETYHFIFTIPLNIHNILKQVEKGVFEVRSQKTGITTDSFSHLYKIFLLFYFLKLPCTVMVFKVEVLDLQENRNIK